MDAVRAITRLAAALAAIMATCAVWEDADLQASLVGACDDMVVVEAALDGRHSVRWHPIVMHIETTMHGSPVVRPEWGTPVTLENAPLPPVMRAVLDTWWALGGDPGTVFSDLITDGYRPTIFER